MTPRHARRYSLLRERLTARRAVRHLPKHRHNALTLTVARMDGAA